MLTQSDWYRKLLNAITSIQAHLAGSIHGRPLFEGLLASLLELSDSEYGFIGETLIDQEGRPYLRTHAITDIAWNEETRRFYEENIADGLEFRNLDTLFGAVMTTEKLVISNDPLTDHRRGGLPAGHPPLDSFLGIPLHSGGSMVGMLGVANRSGGYTEDLVHALDPLFQTCATAIFAFRADVQQKRAEQQLHDAQARTRGMLDGVFDGIVTIDEKGLIESINQAAERMFGYAEEEVVGSSIALLAPEPLRPGITQRLADYLATGSAVIGQDQELSAARRNGENFPMQLRVTEVEVNGRRLFTGIIRDLSKQQEVEKHVEELVAELEQSRYGQMIGRSRPMRHIYQVIEEVAAGRWPVLIEGETGVGKELVARAVHAAASPRHRPFVATNVAGLTDSLAASQLFGHRRGAFTGAIRDQKGLFESAEGGTLFLDEIGDVSATVQTSLLRVLEQGEIVRVGDSMPRKVEVRILCASNANLGDLVERGLFRRDLLYRLQVARILVPPLRERSEDIPLLLESFLAEARAATGRSLNGFHPNAMRILTTYTWPGNVRELRNTIDYVSIHCKKSVADVADLPREIQGFSAPSPATSRTPTRHGLLAPVTTERDQAQSILAALESCGGNRSRAAETLGISRATFYRRMKAFGLS